MIRNIVSRITGIIAERSHALRKKYEAPIKVSFEPQRNTGSLRSSAEGLFLAGETYDLSGTGVAFIVSAIRIKENYLVSHDERILNAEIDLPGGKIKMKLIGRRYERVGMHLSTERYIVGAEIVEISPAHRKVYDYFLRHGARRFASSSTALEAGID